MKNIKLFILFWKNFIFGDTPYIALILLWSLASIYMFTQFSFNVWWALPLIVTLVIFMAAFRFQKKPLSYIQHILIVFMASASVLLLPLGIFRLLSHTHVNDVSTSFLMYTLYCVGISLLCGLIAKRHLLIGHCLALIVSVLLIIY